jgi:hypothetical protein
VVACATGPLSEDLIEQAVITVTVFPPRCLRSRITRTMPSFFCAGVLLAGRSGTVYKVARKRSRS